MDRVQAGSKHEAPTKRRGALWRATRAKDAPTRAPVEVWVGSPPDTNECATPVEPSDKRELSPH